MVSRSGRTSGTPCVTMTQSSETGKRRRGAAAAWMGSPKTRRHFAVLETFFCVIIAACLNMSSCHRVCQEDIHIVLHFPHFMSSSRAPCLRPPS
jgi:hypothetical protein